MIPGFYGKFKAKEIFEIRLEIHKRAALIGRTFVEFLQEKCLNTFTQQNELFCNDL